MSFVIFLIGTWCGSIVTVVVLALLQANHVNEDEEFVHETKKG